MVTYKHIGYSMENEHGFKFKTNYKPTIMDFLRHVLEPTIKEIKGPEVEIPLSTIKNQRVVEEFSQTS